MKTILQRILKHVQQRRTDRQAQVTASMAAHGKLTWRAWTLFRSFMADVRVPIQRQLSRRRRK